MTNFFGFCALQCEECGEVLVTISKTIFPEKIDRKILPPKNPPHTSPSKTSNFITMYFWDRFCTRYEDQLLIFGTSEDQVFQIPTSEKCSFGLVFFVSSCLFGGRSHAKPLQSMRGTVRKLQNSKVTFQKPRSS